MEADAYGREHKRDLPENAPEGLAAARAGACRNELRAAQESRTSVRHGNHHVKLMNDNSREASLDARDPSSIGHV